MKAYLALWSPQLLSILRIVTGFLFVCAWHAKMARVSSGTSRAPEFWSTAGISGALELAGGALMLVGLFHAAGCVHSLRSDGVRLFLATCAARASGPS
jgi:putative oxidoreductase